MGPWRQVPDKILLLFYIGNIHLNHIVTRKLLDYTRNLDNTQLII